MLQQYPSALLEKAVGEFSKLPGIGRKTALRLVLFLLRQPVADVEVFAEALTQMRREVKYCRVCHNISDTEVCPICADNRRDRSQVCVVENVQDDKYIESKSNILSPSTIRSYRTMRKNYMQNLMDVRVRVAVHYHTRLISSQIGDLLV